MPTGPALRKLTADLRQRLHRANAAHATVPMSEPPISEDILRKGIGLAAATTLAAIAGIHVLWGSGRTWPEANRRALADLVVGTQPMPGRAACYSVAGLLGAASVATSIATSTAQGTVPEVARFGSRVTGVTLLARGVIGFVVSNTALTSATDRFRRNDRRLYSPLCVVLGAAVLAGRHRQLTQTAASAASTARLDCG